MGVFSFIKEAGAKIFNREPKNKVPASVAVAKETMPEAAEPETNDLDAYYRKVAVLEEEVDSLELQVLNRVIQLNKEQDTVIINGQAQSQADREKVVLALGNVEGICQVDDRMTVPEEAPESTYYTVQKGDWLSKISKKVYGDANKYNVIFEANKPMLKDPDLIYPGQVLRIPPLD